MRIRTVISSMAACGLAFVMVGCSSADSAPATASSSTSTSVTREAASRETHVVWQNNTGTDLTITITDVVSGDFDGDSRPDHAYPQGINGYTLESGASLDERIEVNTNSVPHFNFTPSGTRQGSDSVRLVYSDDPEEDIEWWAWQVEGGKERTVTKSFTYVDAAGKSRSGTVDVTMAGDRLTTITFK